MQCNHQDTIPTEILTEPLKNASVEPKRQTGSIFLQSPQKKQWAPFPSAFTPNCSFGHNFHLQMWINSQDCGPLQRTKRIYFNGFRWIQEMAK